MHLSLLSINQIDGSVWFVAMQPPRQACMCDAPGELHLTRCILRSREAVRFYFLRCSVAMQQSRDSVEKWNASLMMREYCLKNP